MTSKLTAADARRLTRKFAALADVTRRAMLTRLMQGEATLTELAAPFAMTMPAIAKHLQVLTEAGLVTRDSAIRGRPARLSQQGFEDVGNWLAQHEAFWRGSMGRLRTVIDGKAKRGG